MDMKTDEGGEYFINPSAKRSSNQREQKIARHSNDDVRSFASRSVREKHGLSEDDFSQTKSIKTNEYISKRRFGRLGKANVESDSEEEDAVLLGKTPNTKRRIKEEIIKTDIKKLNTI